MIFNEVSPPKAVKQPITYEPQEHIDYINDDDARDALLDVKRFIESLDSEVKMRAAQYYITFKYKNSNFVIINTKKRFFYLDVKEEGIGAWDGIKISNKEDFTDEIKLKIRKSFKGVGGKLKEE